MPNVKITKENFPLIKKMLNYGAIQKEIAEIFDISKATASRIDRSENLEDYRRLVRGDFNQYKKNHEDKLSNMIVEIKNILDDLEEEINKNE